MFAFWFAVLALAIWRLASMLARERGAFSLFSRIRWALGVQETAGGEPDRDEDGNIRFRSVTSSALLDTIFLEIAQGAVCLWCNSVWLGVLGSVVMSYIEPLMVITPARAILLVPAFSGAAILIESFVNGRSNE